MIGQTEQETHKKTHTERNEVQEVTERKTTVSSYFGKNASSWRNRYQAKDFDSWEYQTRGNIALEWLAELKPPSGGRMLEIGCGAGVQSSAAAQLGWDVVAVDFATGMLAEARQNSKKPSWVAAVVEALPFQPQSYDVVLMNGVIGYVENPQQALVNVREQLRPNGKFIVSWASPHPLFFEAVGKAVSAIPDAIYLGLKRLVTGKPHVPPDIGDIFYEKFLRRWTPEEFYGMLETAGFTIDRVRSQNFGQFRFMDKALWGDQVDIALSEWLDRIAGVKPHKRLRDGARTHIAQVSVRKS
jgi:2-polyprenyl-3-methyl-5-hydroxy-6-metoxy-1,4-benzoquinol methylase